RARSSDASQGAEHSRDTIDRAPRNDVRRDERSQSRPPVQDRQTDRNPFDKLRRADVDAPAHELGESLDVDTEVDFRPKSLGKMAVLGRHASKPLVLKSFTKVLEGTMLVADDSQGAAARKEGIGRDEMRQQVSRLVVSASKTQGEKRLSRIQESLRLMRFGNDPHTFVQRVMRESYAIGNEIMRDYAERMQRTNELRKEVRAEASRTREAITRNAGKEDDEPLDVPFDMMDVDHASQQLNEAFYSVQEAEDIAAQTAAANNEEGEELAPWDQPSQLTGAQKRNLEFWAEDDDRIEDNLDEIVSAVGRMSNEDFGQYLYPIMVKLAVKDDEDELVRILDALPPYLFFQTVATKVGDEQTSREFSRENAGAFAGAVAAPFFFNIAFKFKPFGNSIEGESVVQALTGSQYDDYVRIYNNKLDDLSDEVGVDLSSTVSERGVDGMLAEYEAIMLDPEHANGQRPAHTDPARYEAGNRKQAHTVKELQDYEKYLEDQMNSIGDDAQLQNVELQNQLQRQQQLLQMMSNMSKAMHDAAMGIVRNFGG
ncbi:MAG: hypothetical protein AAFZ38_11945, partial [Myxococcota bacterium]